MPELPSDAAMHRLRVWGDLQRRARVLAAITATPTLTMDDLDRAARPFVAAMDAMETAKKRPHPDAQRRAS